MKSQKKQPRQLRDLQVDEVSMVDNPANETTFLLLKREGDEGGDGGVDFNETLSDAAGAMQATLEQVVSRIEAAKKNGNDKAVLKDIIKEDEQEALAKLLALVEKVFGPFERIERLSDSERSLIERVMQMEGMPEGAVSALRSMLGSGHEENEKFTTAKDFEAFKTQMSDFMVNIAEALSRLAPKSTEA